MGFWSKFDCFNYIYQSRVSANECMQSVQISKNSFGPDLFNPHFYEYILLSRNQILLVFNGTRFGKSRKTKYIATFWDNENGCRIALDFQHELLGLPPMTSTCHLDHFMEEKMKAYRCQD